MNPKSSKTATKNREGIPEILWQFFFLSLLQISEKPLDLTNPHLDTRKIIKLVCTDADGNKLTVKLKKSGKKKVIQSVKVKIAKELKKSISTITREIKRNSKVIASDKNDCIYRKACHQRRACERKCDKKLCKFNKLFNHHIK